MVKSTEELKLERLNSKRENLFIRIQNCLEAGQAVKADPNNATKLESFKIRFGTFHHTMLDMRETVQEIIVVKQKLKPDEPPNYGILDAVEDMGDMIEFRAAEFIQNPIPPARSANSGTGVHESKIHMPKIELVKFDGEDLALWPLFHENFKHLVHAKQEFSRAEKLQYLLGSLTGKALKTCNSVEAIPDNYDVIWKLLEDTYHDTKFLASSYLDRLLNFRSLPNNNPSNLQTFLEKFETNVTALKRLKIKDLDDYILTHLAMVKLPQESVNAFEMLRTSQGLPTYAELIKFIRNQSRILVKTDKIRTSSNSPSSSNVFRTNKTFFADNRNSGNKKCISCHKGEHLLKDCKHFKDSPHEQKFRLIKDNNLCINCFSSKHKVSICPSNFRCIKCRFKHHTILHRDDSPHVANSHSKINPRPTTSNQETGSTFSNPSSTSNSNSSAEAHIFCTNVNTAAVNKTKIVLLSTAIVKVVDKWNKQQNVRFLVDSGSMSNVITVACCKRLGLPYSKISSNIVGIGGAVKPLKGRANLIIHSNINFQISYPIEVLLVDKVTSFLPEVVIDTDSLNHLHNLPLADPTFYSPGAIDGILGASIFTEIMRSHRVVGSSDNPTAIQTTLGYLVMGPATPLNALPPTHTFCSFLKLDSLMEKMWELENFTPPSPTSEDAICENLFEKNVSRDASGRYTVSLPFKMEPSELGESYFLAKNRLLSLEKRLEKFPKLRTTYSSILQDYLDQGHMSLVPPLEINKLSYYIPHHCIFKDSISTPCRIVFDASMKTVNGKSLNDILYTGPKLQNNVVTILLNFRLFPIAMISDIKQMYRQINIADADRPYQRILWRFNTTDPISIYQLNRVTFGVKSSPFLSLRTVHQLAKDECLSYPQAITHVLRDLYMDDLICSVPDIPKALNVHTQLVNLFQAGGFQLVKWMSNSSELLSEIPNNLQIAPPMEFNKDGLKVLGLQWNPTVDKFSFKIELNPTPCTKRNMLSLVARTFDPLGFLAPLTLFVKLLIKHLWELKIDWDQEPPNDIETLWKKFQSECKLLCNMEIPRHLLVLENSSIILVGFADASPAGYASVIYSRTEDSSGHVNVTFLCAQSKVAPTAKVTLPRLELCAAALLAKLLSHTRDTYSSRKSINSIYALSDSTITLHWIHSSPSKWKTFVSHRVSKIQSYLPPSNWYFVSGKQNASDCASRGLTPSALVNHPTYFSGPPWLFLNPLEWPIKSFNEHSCDTSIVEEANLVHIVTAAPVSPLYRLIEYFSSWTKLLHSVIYVLRFVKILPRNNEITKSDLEQAENTIIRAVQQRHFPDEYKFLLANKPIKSHLRRLNPFIQNKIIRVGGRLSYASIDFDHKHPILLPKTDPFVTLLIDYNHKKYCHTGTHLLQSLLQQNYWIVSARDIIRQRIWKCNTCFRLHPKPNYPLMADLPFERVNQAKAFLSTGVDFTGAFYITLGRRRGIKSQKAYVCLFICLATKAVHLELASSLSTDSFIAAFKRFLSRRGNCSTLFSDCGTNFIGAKAQLNEIYNLIRSNEYKEALSRELHTHKIEWKFNPPSAPHFGGIWEANIKSVKSHLARVIGTQILTSEEFSTVLCQIEALLNSRPLCSLSTDPNDPVALTPAHFLYGGPLNAFPAEDVSAENPNRVNRYKLLDFMIQHYWKRWHLEYLSTLQTRQKWNTNGNPAKIGTIVIIIQDNIPPLQWPLAVIENLYSGKDGVPRVALVRTKNSSYTRPVAKLCPLPHQ